MLKYCKHLAAAFVACLVLVLLAQPAEAVGGQQGAFTYELKGNGTAVITKFDWSKHSGGDVYVPRSIDGYNVAEIGELAFSNSAVGYTSAYDDPKLIGKEVAIVLPDTITIIGEKAFFCTKITSCIIPANVHTIGAGAFAGCVNLPMHAVNSQNKTFAVIDGVLFNKAQKELVSMPLKTVVREYSIPNGIRSIGDYAFYGHRNIQLNFTDTVVSIGNYTFAYSYNILFKFTSSITTVGDFSFYKSKTKTATKSPSLTPTTIGSYAFADAGYNDNWALSLNLSRTVEMGEGAFSGYGAHIDRALTTLAQSQIRFIPAHAFENCRYDSTRADSTVALPETLIEIGDYAFAGLERAVPGAKLKLTLPSSLTRIGTGAFKNVDLTGFAVSSASRLQYIGSEAFMNAGMNLSVFEIPSGVKTVGARAFFTTRKGKLSKIIIPTSVTSIGDDVVERSHVVLQITSGSYADIWASENGYPIESDNTDWLFE